MRAAVALLAAALCGLAGAGCGGDGAEPGAPPRGATLVLDFQPNAVHSGIYAAAERGLLAHEGVDLEIQEPSSTSDGAKLLEAGRADFAILDINDFGIARRRGLEIVAVAAIVQRPLASVIAVDRDAVGTPAELAGRTIGVTGVPSDDAVLRTVLAAGGIGPGDVTSQTVGFQAAALLASGQLDAATAFWNAEGVELAQQGLLTREFRVDEFGAPRYPELLLAAPGGAVDEGPPDPGSTVCRVLRGIEGGYGVLADDPGSAVDDLLAATPESNPDSQNAQLSALVAADAFSTQGADDATAAIQGRAVLEWLDWAETNGALPRSEDPKGRDDLIAGFRDDLLPECSAASEPAAAPGEPTPDGEP
ncbi:MAG: ABC transporter substrate-binding protein [Actinomycetota bacterium]|nr:ABC transporter substrate-binding protein [Actinomycetota bacterium]